ncbi:Conjugative transfer protein TrbE [Salipiger abyssi]|uniref:Conjugative transfer protein TrbE n=1 Tax=Salipiger abyssi TaxID=1250539 RepID=A0A1P8V0J1_9RHOB|nr:Conjugative transfer protein TrbE [Salipiger abyssi]
MPDQPLAGGLEPRLGDHHLRVLTITAFPGGHDPGLLDELNRLAFPYRWSTGPSSWTSWMRRSC